MQEHVSVVDLSHSDPTRIGLIYPEITLPLPTHPPVIPYVADAFGLSSARMAVAAELKRQGASVDKDQIVLTASTSEAYAFLFKLLCDPGDEILVPRPSYPLFDYLAQAESISLTPYRLHWDGQWHLDISDIRRHITSKTRAIVVVNPNNPTGSYLKHNDLQALLELNMTLISDEVFSPYTLTDNSHICRSILTHTTSCDDQTLQFALGGISKHLALPHLKCGWLCVKGNSSLTKEALWRLECIADTFLSVNTPVQHALPNLLASAPQIQAQIMQRIVSNLSRLKTLCAQQRSPITLRSPEGGWSAVIQLPSVHTDEEWALSLLESRHVYIQPGYFYDFMEPACMVLSLLTEPQSFQFGIEQLYQHVEKTCAQS